MPNLSDPETALSVARLVMMAGLASALSIATINNIVDRGTNVTLLGRMLRMDELKLDPELGNGIKHRAIGAGSALPGLALTLIVIVQVGICAGLWWAAAQQGGAVLDASVAEQAQAASTLALTAFLALWLFFLCGGWYMGYWMKMLAPHQVHLALIIISIGALILVNLP